MFHSIPLELRGRLSGRKSVGVFSHRPNGTAIVFVHGFMGHPTGTWSDFPGLLSKNSKARGADGLFFGYDSVRSEPVNSARELRLFLDSLWHSPREHWPRAIAESRGGQQKYKRFILVAHSLGAVVSRIALHNALGDQHGSRWASSAKLLLFAPAHKGACRKEFIDLLGYASLNLPKISTLFRISSAILNRFVPAIKHLASDSALLRTLEDDAMRFHKDRKSSATAKLVVFGKREYVVLRKPFGCDPWPPLDIPGNHTSVCKPRDTTYMRPLNEVANQL